MAEILVFSVCALVAWFTMFYAIPWMGKNGVLYGLHGLRDRLYRVRRRAEGADGTQLYRDIEFLLTASIYMIRDVGFRSTFTVVHTILTAKKGDESPPSIYHDELENFYGRGSPARSELEEMADISLAHHRFLWLFLILGHPFMTILAAVMFVLGIPIMLALTIWFLFSSSFKTSAARTERSLRRVSSMVLAREAQVMGKAKEESFVAV